MFSQIRPGASGCPLSSSWPWPTSWRGSAGRCCAATRNSTSTRRSDRRSPSSKRQRPEAQQQVQVRQAEAATKGESRTHLRNPLFPDEATRSTVSGNKPVKGQAHLPRVGVRAARAVCHPGAVLFKTHHQDAVYVSEYRSASALKSRFIEEGSRENVPGHSLSLIHISEPTRPY